MVSINTNLSSMIVQQNLTKSTNSLNLAIERMTTGFKINHASDNAANYSISNNMNSQISSYTVAEDNASMGIDMVKTAMDSMDLISNHLSRIRDLAEQASNGTYGQDSLNAINQEVRARVEEVNRIIANTEFNGIQLLEGEKSESNVTGYFLKPVEQLTENEAIAQGYTIIKTKNDLENIKNNTNGKYILMNDIDLEESYLSYSLGYSYIFGGELNGNGHVIKNLSVLNSNGSEYVGLFGVCANAKIKNLGLENINITIGLTSACIGGLMGSGANNNISNVYVKGKLGGDGDIIGGLFGNNEDTTLTDCYSDITPLTSNVKAICGSGYNFGFSSNIYWNKSNCLYPKPGSETLAGATGVTTEELDDLAIDPRTLGSEVEKTIKLQVGINGDEGSQISLLLGGLGLSGLSLNITTNDKARNALSVIDGYLSTVSSKQTEYGAVFNRLESAIESIGVSMENLTSSLSTIRDADVAKESSAYIRSQILQQASATLLATANQSPSIALQLL